MCYIAALVSARAWEQMVEPCSTLWVVSSSLPSGGLDLGSFQKGLPAWVYVKSSPRVGRAWSSQTEPLAPLPLSSKHLKHNTGLGCWKNRHAPCQEKMHLEAHSLGENRMSPVSFLDSIERVRAVGVQRAFCGECRGDLSQGWGTFSCQESFGYLFPSFIGHLKRSTWKLACYGFKCSLWLPWVGQAR